jgi:hypothetical protein
MNSLVGRNVQPHFSLQPSRPRKLTEPIPCHSLKFYSA